MIITNSRITTNCALQVLERTEWGASRRYEKGKTLIMAHDTSPQHTSINMKETQALLRLTNEDTSQDRRSYLNPFTFF